MICTYRGIRHQPKIPTSQQDNGFGNLRGSCMSSRTLGNLPAGAIIRRSTSGELVIAFAVLVVLQIFLLERYFPGFSDTSAQVTPQFAIAREGLVLAAVLIPTLLLALVERRSTLTHGLGGQHRLRYFAVGLGCGLTFASLLARCGWPQSIGAAS